MLKKILSIVGARPQFIKHAPMHLELSKKYNALTLHTGQHYDENMSQVFFNDLKIPAPDFRISLTNAKTQGEQTAEMLVQIEKICNQELPDALLIYGDTNSTLAGALVAAKNHIPLIHIEAGLRSFNRQMPEEVNRIIADEFSYLLFCPTDSALENLAKEGIVHERIFKTDDVMCDTLHLISSNIKRQIDEDYFYTTLHRPYNVDDKTRLLTILTALNKLPKTVYFSVHPRTNSNLQKWNINIENFSNIQLLPPLSYTDNISMQKFAQAVITDSGGIQKEAYILKTPCITVRSETEWTETLEGNWNQLIFDDFTNLNEMIATKRHSYKPNLYGNGNAATAIVEIISQYI